MNTCWVPYLEMIPRHFIMATIALFSASAFYFLVIWDTESESDCSFTQCILNIKTTKVVKALFGCYMASAMCNCCHCCENFVDWLVWQFCKLVHGCIIQFVWCPQNRTLFEAIKYIFIGRMHVCLAKTCHLHFWQNYQNLLLFLI